MEKVAVQTSFISPKQPLGVAVVDNMPDYQSRELKIDAPLLRFFVFFLDETLNPGPVGPVSI